MIPRSRRLGIALVTASALAWSTTGLFTRLIPLDAATLLVWRGLFGALGLIAVLAAFEGSKGLKSFARLGVAGWAYAAISALGMLCFIAALRLTSVAHVAIIYAVVPFLAAALTWAVLHERPSRDALLASAAAFAGAIVMIGLSRDGGFSGDLLALGMTLAMAAMMVLARRFPAIPTLPAAALSALLSAAIALPFSTAASLTTTDLALLAAFGLTNSALGLALFLMGSRLIQPVETALISALDAPLAPLWVWLFFAERPGPATLAGGTIVFAAVLWHIRRSARPGAHPAG